MFDITLKPFTCIHCGAETQNFAIIHFKYDQAVYDHMYGVNHPKGYREVDAGEGAVCTNSEGLYGKKGSTFDGFYR